MQANIWNYQIWTEETRPKKLRENIEFLLYSSDFNILNFIDYDFKPFGYTAVWLLSESHIACHSFPEENKSYIELSSCNEDKYKKFKTFAKNIL